jgi:hypothetical protein
MKKHWVTTIALLGLMVAAGRSSAQAEIVGRLKAEIPFSFYVGERELPPGHYTVTVKDLAVGLMEITSDDGRSSAFFLTNERQERSEPAMSELVFDKYGETNFLSRIVEEGSTDSAVVPKSRLEHRIEKAGEEAGKVAIALR